MLDSSMEEVREYVAKYRLNKNKHEKNVKNRTTQVSDDESIKLLESDTSLNVDNSPRKVHLVEKTLKNNAGDQNCFNVLKVGVNDVEGLTFEIRESFYSKLHSALLSNYKTTFSKKDSIFLTESNIYDIAKKMEYGILSTAQDLNSYKLAGAEAIVNIEKETCNRNMYKSLFNEIELLRLRNKMQTVAIENPQVQLSVLSTEAEFLSRKESKSEDAQPNTESTTVNTVNNDATDLLTSQNAAVSDAEYFSCNSADHSSIESQQNSETCTMNSNMQEPIINLPREKQLTEVETATVGELRSILPKSNVPVCNNNDYIKNIKTEPNNVLNEIHSNNVKVQLDLVGTNGISQEKRRKRKDQPDLGPSINCLPVQQNKSSVEALSKRRKLVKSETISETSATTTNDNNKNKEKSYSDPNDCLQVRSNTNAEKNVTIANETTPYRQIKHEPGYIQTEPMLSPLTDLSCNQYNKKQISLENGSTNEPIHKKRFGLSNNGKIHNSSGKNSSQDRINKSEIFSTNVMCRIKADIDLSQYSIHIGNKELIDENFWENVAEKEEKSISVDEVPSNKLENNTILQISEHNLKNSAASLLSTPLHSKNNTEVTETDESSVPDINASTNAHENSIVEENNCLIDEEAFELERARLDKLCEEMKKCSEESNVDVIHSDYEKIFGIIIPIIRKYYPSEFIPDEVCYGHILQRLQIDLTHADMCDDDKAFYVTDSIKTRRYLCDNCIVQ